MKIPLGVYVGNPNDVDPSEQAATAAQFNSFVAAVGRTPTFMDTFIDFSQDFSTFPGNAKWNADSWAASPFLKGVTPVIGVPMATDAVQGDAAFKAIISGQYDDYYRGIVTAWQADGYSTMYIRLGWEQNGNWMPWSQGSGQTLQDFIAAFQHLATVLRSVPGTDVKIVWNPNDGDPSTATLSYPGDQYVDVIGIDQYSPSAGSPWGVAQAQAFAAAHNKPFAICETGTGIFTNQGPSAAVDVGASWPNYLQSLLTAPGAPPTAFVNIWDHNVPDGDWAFSGETVEPNEAAGWNAFANADIASSAPPPSPSPTPTPITDKLVLNLSEDQWMGDAKFVVSVNGVRLGPAQPVTALYALGQSEAFTFTGNWGGPNATLDVAIRFTNDAWGGTPSTDRNLHVGSIVYDGKVFNENVTLYTTSTQHFTV